MNPFAPKSRSLLYGREQSVRGLLNKERSGQSVVLIAGRRCGKTSLLQCVHRLLSEGVDPGSVQAAWRQTLTDATDVPVQFADRPHLPVMSNLDGFAPESLEHALGLIGVDIAAALTQAGCPTEPPSAGGSISTTAMEKWLRHADNLSDSTRYAGFALLIDQVEDLFAQPWCHSFMSFLRLLDDRVLRTRAWIVLAGSHKLDVHRHQDGSPLNTFHRVDLPGLGYMARRRMMIEPFARDGLLPPSDVQTRIIDRAAAGHPWLLTLLLERLYAANDRSADTVERMVDDVFESEQETLTRWAKVMNETAWQIYKDVVRFGQVNTDQLRGTDRLMARRLLEYQALVHRTSGDQLEPGPELFRRWAADEGRIEPPYHDRLLAGRADPDLPPGCYRHEVALSYAGSEQPLAREISDGLARLQIAHFYDQDLGAELWGVDLSQVLPATYGREARLVVLLVSSRYVQRQWPMVEQRAAIARAIAQGWEGILVVSTDGTRLPDVPESVVVLDLSRNGKVASDVVLSLQERLKSSAGRR